uniref:Uncharacterized protein n=1 Tax=Photinus pyralis TaxID=7054 RepID=A0A1Y1JXG9_PHOPY
MSEICLALALLLPLASNVRHATQLQLRFRHQYLPSHWQQHIGPLPLMSGWSPATYDLRGLWTQDDGSAFRSLEKKEHENLNKIEEKDDAISTRAFVPITNPSRYRKHPPSPYQTYGGSLYQAPNPYGNGYVSTSSSSSGKMLKTTTTYTTSITLVKTIRARRVVEVIDLQTNEKNVFEIWDSSSTEQVEESTISDRCSPNPQPGVKEKVTVVKVVKITTTETRTVSSSEPLPVDKTPLCPTVKRSSLANTTVVLTNATKATLETAAPGSGHTKSFTSADHLIANAVMNLAPTYKRITTRGTDVLATTGLQDSPSPVEETLGTCTFIRAGQSPRLVETNVNSRITVTPLDFVPYMFPFGQPPVRFLP